MSEKIVLKNVRLSYEHIFHADSIGDSDPKYSASWIIPKDHPQVKAVKEALTKALDEKFPGKRKPGAPWPSSFHSPLADGDELADEHPEYAGSYVLKSSSKNRPLVMGRRKEQLTEEDGVIYSGCYCNASLAAAGFEFEKLKKGVTVYLNGVQFVRDGERLAGYDASGDFDELDDEADDYDGLI
nr:MAG TPA: DNA helix destabilizing protein [Caudoviricetes sp.]